ncbi:MAG: GNAT family N-acetyltransferase [Fimbriimonadaceae bacterium]|nr:GNAT family N-acetyltransferase [Fimbriimonadaceae bacterium]
MIHAALDWVPATVLEDEHIRLEPLLLSHVAGLQAARDPDTFQFYVTQQPPTNDEAGMTEFVARLLAQKNMRPFAVINQENVVGMTTLMDIRPEARGLEIGTTWYALKERGTKVNPACKRLLLGFAFDDLGAIRVQLKCDATNMRSRAAIEKLGAQFEGVLRQHGYRLDGSVRDTAMYSIVTSEWPSVRARLTKRLT